MTNPSWVHAVLVILIQHLLGRQIGQEGQCGRRKDARQGVLLLHDHRAQDVTNHAFALGVQPPLSLADLIGSSPVDLLTGDLRTLDLLIGVLRTFVLPGRHH